MKNTILMLAMLWSILSASAQVQPNSMDSLTSWIEGAVRTAIFEQKHFDGRINLHFNKNESSKLFIHVVPAYAIDSTVLRHIADVVPNSLYIDRDSLSVSASYKFDVYTGELFFTSWNNIYPVNRMFAADNTLRVEARGGVGAFRKRWAAYIHQLVPLDTTTKYITIGKIRWLSFDLDFDGTIILNNSNTSDSVLSTFLKTERPWMPSSHDSRSVRVRISVDLPETISHLYPTHWDSDDRVSPIFEEYAHNLYHKKIFVENYAMPYRDGLNVISMVNDHGKVAAVRYHQGDLEACRCMEEQIRVTDIIKYYRESYRSSFDRIYFYSYQ